MAPNLEHYNECHPLARLGLGFLWLSFVSASKLANAH